MADFCRRSRISAAAFSPLAASLNSLMDGPPAIAGAIAPGMRPMTQSPIRPIPAVMPRPIRLNAASVALGAINMQESTLHTPRIRKTPMGPK